jgi:hypothetical protein
MIYELFQKIIFITVRFELYVIKKFNLVKNKLLLFILANFMVFK